MFRFLGSSHHLEIVIFCPTHHGFRYVTTAMLQTGHEDFAQSLLADAIADFKAHGIYEDVDYGIPAGSPAAPYHGVLNYTASATNVLQAVRMLERHQRGVG